MDGLIARLGMIAGWLSLVGIFGYHVGLTIVAGQRVSGTTDAAAITAYYRQPIVAYASIEQFFVIVAVLVFFVALREICASASPRARFFATVALFAGIVEAPLLLTETSLQAAIVTVVSSGGDPLGLFRFWDVLYNSSAYVLEATWLAGFGLAIRDLGAMPRWLPRFSFVVAALQIVNLSAIWIGIPDAVTLVGNMCLGIWFAGASVGLGRLLPRRVTSAATA